MHWIYCLLEYKSQLQHLFLLLFRVCLTLRMSCVFCSISCTENGHTHIGGIEAKMAKQMSYMTGFKLKVIELAIKNGNKCWKRVWSERKASAWLEEKEDRAGKSTLSSPGVKAHWPEFENRLYDWVLERRMNELAFLELWSDWKLSQWLRVCLPRMLRASLVVCCSFTALWNEKI